MVAENHNIVVIGGSAGAIKALQQIFSQLPPTLPASFFVVLHIPVDRPSKLADVAS